MGSTTAPVFTKKAWCICLASFLRERTATLYHCEPFSTDDVISARIFGGYRPIGGEQVKRLLALLVALDEIKAGDALIHAVEALVVADGVPLDVDLADLRQL
jgi:hypothetical protein